MSVTTRRWSDSELRKAKRAKTEEERWLATLLLNTKTYSEGQISSLPKKRHTYTVFLECQEDDEPIIIHATDVKMLRKFIEAEYTCPASDIFEAQVKYKTIQRRR